MINQQATKPTAHQLPDPFKPETPQKKKNKVNEEGLSATATSRKVYQQEVSSNRSNKEMGCNCSKSKCLKMYCACFSSGNMCKPSCYCINCKNFNDNMERSEAINEVITKDPHAFSRKTTTLDLIGSRCNCKKSNCLKKYCDCFKLGKGCGKECQCLGCLNKQKEQSPQKLQKLTPTKLIKLQ